VWDATGGFKCFRRVVLESIDFDHVRSNGYAFQIEMSFRAWKRKFRIAEIPIVFVDRTEGTSKMSKSIVREAVWMVWRLRWWAMRGKI
jgi:dolichol-phosphate mannosyltransferase